MKDEYKGYADAAIVQPKQEEALFFQQLPTY